MKKWDPAGRFHSIFCDIGRDLENAAGIYSTRREVHTTGAVQQMARLEGSLDVFDKKNSKYIQMVDSVKVFFANCVANNEPIPDDSTIPVDITDEITRFSQGFHLIEGDLLTLLRSSLQDFKTPTYLRYLRLTEGAKLEYKRRVSILEQLDCCALDAAKMNKAVIQEHQRLSEECDSVMNNLQNFVSSDSHKMVQNARRSQFIVGDWGERRGILLKQIEEASEEQRLFVTSNSDASQKLYRTASDQDTAYARLEALGAEDSRKLNQESCISERNNREMAMQARQELSTRRSEQISKERSQTRHETQLVQTQGDRELAKFRSEHNKIKIELDRLFRRRQQTLTMKEVVTLVGQLQESLRQRVATQFTPALNSLGTALKRYQEVMSDATAFEIDCIARAQKTRGDVLEMGKVRIRNRTAEKHMETTGLANALVTVGGVVDDLTAHCEVLQAEYERNAEEFAQRNSDFTQIRGELQREDVYNAKIGSMLYVFKEILDDLLDAAEEKCQRRISGAPPVEEATSDVEPDLEVRKEEEESPDAPPNLSSFISFEAPEVTFDLGVGAAPVTAQEPTVSSQIVQIAEPPRPDVVSSEVLRNDPEESKEPSISVSERQNGHCQVQGQLRSELRRGGRDDLKGDVHGHSKREVHRHLKREVREQPKREVHEPREKVTSERETGDVRRISKRVMQVRPWPKVPKYADVWRPPRFVYVEEKPRPKFWPAMDAQGFPEGVSQARIIQKMVARQKRRS
jgi:hypothetical protein